MITTRKEREKYVRIPEKEGREENGYSSPTCYKAKNFSFLEHESKALDKGEGDLPTGEEEQL